MKATLRVLNAGFQTLVVDEGRQGYQHMGFSTGGPLDPVAFYWAKRLSASLKQGSGIMLESIGNLTVELEESAIVAVTGPNIEVTVDDKLCADWSRIKVQAGQQVKVRSLKVGQRHYLCVNGGFNLPVLFGSATTVMREKLGGIYGNGSAVKDNDEIHFPIADLTAIEELDKVTPYHYDLSAPIKVVPGYQNKKFSSLARSVFYSTYFNKTAQSDRMGARLSGAIIQAPADAFYSEGLHLGSIQIPPNGEPIVMLADRQTLGGYPKIGAIARIDIARFAQALPEEPFQFEQTSSYDARNAWRLQQIRWNKAMI